MIGKTLDQKQRDLLNIEMEEKNKEIENFKQTKVQNNINIDNSKNIHLIINPHGKENLEKIDIKHIMNLIITSCNNNINNMIPSMFKKVNIDTEENRNVYIPNVRANYGLILEDNRWNIKAMEELLNDILYDNMDRLEEFVDRNQILFIQKIGMSSFSELKYNLACYFGKFNKNEMIEKPECIKKIKEILIMNRHIISIFYEEITGEKIKLPK